MVHKVWILSCYAILLFHYCTVTGNFATCTVSNNSSWERNYHFIGTNQIPISTQRYFKINCVMFASIGSLVLEKWKMWQRLQTDGLTDGHTKSGQKIKNAIKRSLNNVLFCPTWYTCICTMFLIRVNGAINMTKNKQLVLSD